MSAASHAYGLDIFSFWAPLDQQFLSTITQSARINHIEYISPFWGTYFFGYATYSPALDAMNYTARASTVNAIAAANIHDDILSPTGTYYQGLIGRIS